MVPSRWLPFLPSSVLLGFLVFASNAQAASLTGTVRQAQSQNPVPTARITLFTPNLAFFREARSDGSGEYSFTNVPPGPYQLGCAARDFEYVEVPVNVVDPGNNTDFSLAPETHSGAWEVIGSTAPEFLDATDIAILLPDGRIMYCHDTTDPVLFDPRTGAKTFPVASGSSQGCMNGTLLDDGSVVLAGGQDGEDPGDFRNAVRWVKRFDPVLGTWQRLPDLVHPAGRWYTGLARLADGSLLVMGGGTAPNAERTATCERMDLVTRTWSYTGSLVNPAEFSPSGLLMNGKVLATWWPPQLYDPSTGQWRATGNFNQPNRGWPGHSDHSLVILEDGRGLVLGIRGKQQGNTVMGELYDPATEAWSLTANPDLVRFQSEVVPLPDGRVLVAAGETEANPAPVPTVLGIVRWCDLYNPVSNSWRRVADMPSFREYHAVTVLLPDGRVATTGGTRIKFQVGPTTADIEAFSPPYLYRGVRPRITFVSNLSPMRGSWLTLGISPLTGITSIVVMGTPSTTHWVDGGIPRRLVLPVTQTAGMLVVRLPTDPNRLPLGYYMLFAMVDDIPSEAVIFRVVETPTTSVGEEPRSSIRAVSAFPNPFRQVATIVYEVRVPTQIHIDVLDVSGRLVHTLVEGRFEIEGPHVATWDGRNGSGTRLAPGVYFYRLRGGGEIYSGRLVLLP